MNKLSSWILPVVLFVLFAGTVVGLVFAIRDEEYPDIKNKADCEDPQKSKLPSSCRTDPNCCAIWDSGMCRKGKVSGNVCESKSSPLPILLVVLALGLLIASIIFIVKAIRK